MRLCVKIQIAYDTCLDVRMLCAISKKSDEYSRILSASKRQMNIHFEDQKLKNEAFWNPFLVYTTEWPTGFSPDPVKA